MLKAPLGLAITAADGTARDINDALAALLISRTVTMVGRHLREVVHPDDRATQVTQEPRRYTGSKVAWFVPTQRSAGFGSRRAI